MKVQEIRELIKLIDDSTIDEFEYESEGAKVILKKNKVVSVPVQAAPQPTQTVAQTQVPQTAAPVQSVGNAETAPQIHKESAENQNVHQIVSPMVGTFYSAPNPDMDDYVKVGSKVSNDSVVCIVEAMKLFNEIEADVKGEIVEVLAQNGQLVEYGQPLFLVKTE